MAFDGAHIIPHELTMDKIKSNPELKHQFITAKHDTTGDFHKSWAKWETFNVKITRHEKIHLYGSLNKFLNKNNLKDMTYMELYRSIKKFTDTLQVSPFKCEVKSYEYGVGIPVDNARKIIDSAITHRLCSTSDIPYPDGGRMRTFVHHKYNEFKMYDKIPKENNLLRIENNILRKSATPDIKIRSLADMLNINECKKLVEYVTTPLREMIFIENIDPIKFNNDKDFELLMSRKYYSYWQELNGINKKQRKKEQELVKKINERYGENIQGYLIDFVKAKCDSLLQVTKEDLAEVSEYLSQFSNNYITGKPPNYTPRT